jgi:hypothetical protein
MAITGVLGAVGLVKRCLKERETIWEGLKYLQNVRCMGLPGIW